MNKNSNTYIILYAIIMVVIVALILSFTALKLQPIQKANVENEMKGAILMSIGEGMEADKAANKTAYINEQYTKYIVESYAVDSKGEKVTGRDAFGILGDLKKEYAKDEDERQLPVFVGKSDDGTVRYILPLYGKGLWGPIWGYLAMSSDWNTISGIVLDHQSETPGLGAEIATPVFQNQFDGKTIFEGTNLVGISVLKGAGSSKGNKHAVDAVSGGTITSQGVENMIKDNLKSYAAYISKMKSGGLAIVQNTPCEGSEACCSEANGECETSNTEEL